jgi:CHAT domain-containing protein/Tfp pilus assembly protein PilF
MAKSLDSLSEHYRAQGNYAAALDALQRSLALRTSLGLAYDRAEALCNVGIVLSEQGAYAEADSVLQQALGAARALANRDLEAQVLTELGHVQRLEGRPNAGLRTLERGLAIVAGSAEYQVQASDTRLALANAYLSAGRLTDAARELERSLAFVERSGKRSGRPDILIGMAEINRRRGRSARALALATDARDQAEAMELVDAQWRALTEIGRADAALGRPAEARLAFEAAIATIEDLRHHLAGTEDANTRFFADRQAPYHERIALAIRASDTADALYYAERSKARLLLDLVGTDRSPVQNAMTDDERSRERVLTNALSSFNAQVTVAAQATAPDADRLASLKRQRDRARLARDAFVTELYATHPALRTDRADVPVARLRDAQALVAGPSAALVEFVVEPRQVWAIVVEGASARIVELPVSGRQLERDVKRFRDQVANRDLRVGAQARQLYDEIMRPLQRMIAGKTDLTIVPDGVLWALPFQALQAATGRYLVEDTAVAYAPSITALREAMARRPASASPRRLLAFGNPTFGDTAVARSRFTLMDDRLEPLPDAESQVKQLADLYGPSSRVYVGAEAREDRWKLEASEYSVLHLATHGVADDRSPLYSYLVLARGEDGTQDDGLLEAWEIMRMRLRADLVVLSACETARGRVSAGEGVIGLMWAFFVAGAPATLVSQWKVESASSTALLVGFHRRWGGGGRGVSKSRALQQSALDLLRTPEYSHPFYWASYILAGDAQ